MCLVEIGRVRWLLVTCGVVVIGLIALLVVRWASSAPFGGDPRGQILAELEPVVSAVPPGSTEVKTGYKDSTWHGKCPDNPSGQSGWYAVQVSARFVSPIGDVANAVNARLEHLGWVPSAPLRGRAVQSLSTTDSVAHWTKRLRHGLRGDAYAYPVPHTDDSGGQVWELSATADPTGYSLPGC